MNVINQQTPMMIYIYWANVYRTQAIEWRHENCKRQMQLESIVLDLHLIWITNVHVCKRCCS